MTVIFPERQVGLVGRALTLMKLHGSGAKYAGMGLWSYGHYDVGRLFIARNSDCLAIKLDGRSAYYLDTVDGNRDETIGSYALVQATMRVMDRALILDDLASI